MAGATAEAMLRAQRVASGKRVRLRVAAMPAGEDPADMLAAGGKDNGGPGERPYHPGYYGAFVLDPDGNNVELVNHNR